VWDTPTIRLEPPQVFILAVIFGWRRRSDGLRRFSSVYIEMARKGAKSTLTAGVALYCLCCEDEPGAQIIVGATTGEQAGKVFNPAKRMVEKTAALREAFGLEAWARSVTCAASGGFIQPINAKGKTQDGWNPHVGILDELHAHPDRSLFDVITSAFGARRNPLRWVITTAGYNTNGVCYEQRTYVAKILEGVVEADHYFGIVFSVDEADDPFDERAWIKANPMLGVTPTLKSMQTEAADAKASPAAEGEFKTKRLNLWLNASGAWLSVPQWKACADPTLSWDDFDGLDCWIGGDLADKDDITALVLAAFDAEQRLIFKPVFWLPDAVMQIRRQAEIYAPWTKGEEPALRLTPGDWVDHNAVEEQVEAWLARYAVRKITFDQFAAAQAMASRINEKHGGNEPLAVILHKKASAVTDPAKELEARVKGGPSRLRHDDNPVMNWMASNVVVARRRDETLLPIKESQMSPNKIDGIDAVINAIQPAIGLQAPAFDVEALVA
jgi:phage terminase large subunit-like protein